MVFSFNIFCYIFYNNYWVHKMKVYLGPYRRFLSPYNITGLLKIIGISEQKCDILGEKLTQSWIGKLLAKINNRCSHRTTYVRIDKYDTWSMDSTLTLIILPMLKQLQASKQGSPFIDDEDVPEELRSTNAPPKENEWDIDDNHHKRWDWVLAEMIWGFEQYDTDWESQYQSGESDWVFKEVEGTDYSELVNGPNHTLKIDRDGLKAHDERISNSLRLFGKYFRALWD
jgi:hypothetical protein